jgi:hypothetical protein
VRAGSTPRRSRSASTADTTTCERFYRLETAGGRGRAATQQGRTVAPSARKRRSQAHVDATIDEAAVLALFDRTTRACARWTGRPDG